jgi:D-lactate dehydrogenase (cytochrome)
MTSVNLFGSSVGAKRRYPEKDTLFIKLQGPTLKSLKESASIVKEVASQKQFGGTGWMEATDEKEQLSIWMDRKNALFSGLALGAKGMTDRGQDGRRIASWSTDVW